MKVPRFQLCVYIYIHSYRSRLYLTISGSNSGEAEGGEGYRDICSGCPLYLVCYFRKAVYGPAEKNLCGDMGTLVTSVSVCSHVHCRREGGGRDTPHSPFPNHWLVNEAFYPSCCLSYLPREWQPIPCPQPGHPLLSASCLRDSEAVRSGDGFHISTKLQIMR